MKVDPQATAKAAPEEGVGKEAAPEDEDEISYGFDAMAARATSIALTIFVLTALTQFIFGSRLLRDESPTHVKLHVIPSSELSISPVDAPAMKLQPSLSQFTTLFKSSVSLSGGGHQASVYVEADVSPEPTDVVVASVVVDAHGHITTATTAMAAATLPPSPLPPVASPPPSPSSPVADQPPPNQPPPPPWWVTDASKAPVAKTAAGAAALAADKPSGRWAVEVHDPRPGTLLLSRGGAAPAGQPYYEDAAVLLVKVCHCRPSIFGLVLPRRAGATNLTVGLTMPPPVRIALHSFVNHSLRVGGPAGPHVTTIHDAKSVAGALELQPGVYAGGCPMDAQRRIDRGELSADAFTFFTGYAAWPIERLRDEVRSGKWGVAKASTELLLAAVREGTSAAALERELL
jgi:putative AlgH/UPF0301 family transcriptional regulator